MRVLRIAVLALAGLPATAARAGPDAGEVEDDERIVFFETAAALDADGTTWRVPIHGWIFEPEPDSLWRRAVLAAVREKLDLEEETAAARRCDRRARLFLADNERGKRIRIRIAGRDVVLPPSAPNGHFETTLALPAGDVEKDAEDGELPFRVVPAEGDARTFAGRVLLVGRKGTSVISDIDDTVRESHVLDREALLRGTFAEPFRAVPGMAGAYAAWARRGARFHFVSSSPWQLHPALAPFLEAEGFPRASFRLKSVRLKDETLLDLFAPPDETKPPAIKAILARFPERTFLLVGDSGERDPEILGAVARRHGKQVRHVLIRRVEGADNGRKRFERAFEGVPKDRWTVFEKAEELDPGLVPEKRDK